jgi:hypothetical protein
MDTRFLESFVAVVEQGSLAEAARVDADPIGGLAQYRLRDIETNRANLAPQSGLL